MIKRTKKKKNSLFLMLIILISFQSSLYNFEYREKSEDNQEDSTPKSSLTTTLRPNINVQTNTFETWSYTNIDEASPDNNVCKSHYKSDGGVGDLLEVGFTNTPTNTIEITEIHFWVYCSMVSTSDGSIYIAPRIGSLFTEDLNTISFVYSYGYKSEDWFGSWTKAQIDAMSFRIRVGSIGGDSDRVWIKQVYCDITYSLIVPPSPPTAVHTDETPCYDGTSNVDWTKSAEATKYQLYESATSGGTYVVIGSELGDVATTTISKTAEQTKYYKVKAGNVAGWSALSTTYATITWDNPPTPTLTKPITETVYTDVDFDVERDSVGAYIDSYDWEVSINSGAYSDTSTSSSSSWSFDPGGLDPGTTTFQFRLQIKNDDFTVFSDYGYSDIRTVIILDTPETPTCDDPQYITPISISWNPTVIGATETNLQNSSNGVDFNDIPGATSSPTFFDVIEGTYYFRVRASNPGTTLYSSYIVVNVNTPSDPGSPTCPSPDFDGDLTVSWSAGTGSTSANLQISTNGVDFTDIPGETSSPSYLTDIEDGSYWFRVRSTNVFGTTYSSISSEIIVNSLAPQITGISNSTKEYGTDIVLIWYIYDVSISNPYHTLNRTVDSIETTLLNSTWENQNFEINGRNTFYFSDYLFQFSINVYNFTLYVYDGLGLSTNITFTVNITNSLSPEIKFINNAHVIEIEESFNLEWIIEDPSHNLSTYDLDYKKNNEAIQNLRNDIEWENEDIFSFQILDFGFTNEIYNITFYVIANDNLGLSTNESFFLYVSNGIPIIVCNVSTGEDIEYGNSTDFEVIIYDPSINTTSIIVSYIYREDYTEILNSSWVSEEKFTFTNLNLSLGIYDFTINVSDGNEYVSENFTYRIVNTISPTITLNNYDSVINRNNITNYITTLQWTISDISQLNGTYSFYYEIDGNTTYVILNEEFVCNYAFDLILANLTKESQEIQFTIIANDGLGLSKIERFTITIESVEIIVEIPEPTNIITILAIGISGLIGLVFVFKRLYKK